MSTIPGSSPVPIGIDSYSYHRYFGETTPWEAPVPVRWQPEDFLRRAASFGVDRVSLQTVYLPPLPEPGMAERLRTLRAELAKNSLTPVLAWGHSSGLEGGTNPQKVEEMHAWLSVASALGCSLMRVVGGNQTWWYTPAAERIARLTPLLRELCARASKLGIEIAIENHADFAMRDLVQLVEDVGAPNFGICLDTGNAVRVGDTLLEAVRLAAPHARMVHLKDLIPQAESLGRPELWWPGTPLGRGTFDLSAVFKILREARFSGGIFVEVPNLFTGYTDEDAAVAESVTYLRQHLT